MRAAFHTLGCKTNSYETQAVIEQFMEAGYEITDFSEPADIYIVNTCSVTAVAAQKSRQMLKRCRKLSPDAVVVACGCYAQEAKDALSKDSYVDLVVGNNEKSRIVDLIKGDAKEKVVVNDLSQNRDYEDQHIKEPGKHTRAYVKIQDGCDRFCSYCIIPYLRGRSRSRRMDEIICEIADLSAAGYKEIVFTGIDISDYRPDANDYGSSALAELVKRTAEMEGIERIRLGSLEAGVISKGFIEEISSCGKLCPQFHLSLQSGCDETLKRMNRHYISAEFAGSVALIREFFPDAAITTDIIAGFPQETDEEFEKTRDFIRKIGFARIHVFPYSRRKGTAADRLPGQLSKREKAKRAHILTEDAKKLQAEYAESFIGREVAILAEEQRIIDGKLFVEGYTRHYVRAAAPGTKDDFNKIVTISPDKIIKENGDLILVPAVFP